MGIDIERILAGSIERGELIGAAAAVITPEGTFSGAAGEAGAGVPMTAGTLVSIASMTKPVTGVAAMQLVEQGRLDLDAPCGDLVPYLGGGEGEGGGEGNVKVFAGYDAAGRPVLRPPARPVTLRHLLTHTSGFGYDFTDDRLARYLAETHRPSVMDGTRAWYQQPLLFDPGDEWRYGIGIDWVGQVIEAATGTRADEYVTAAVLEPLGMADSSFYLPADRADRAASVYRRTPDGLLETEYSLKSDAEVVLAGGAMYSTALDYLRFARFMLTDGEMDGTRLVSAETMASMAANHIGDLAATGWRTGNPQASNDVDFFRGTSGKWGLTYLINTEATPEGRSPGSLAWAGIANTYFWVDRARQIAGVFVTQLLPFWDGYALDAFRAVERAAYA